MTDANDTASFSSADHAWMARALQLAQQGRYTTHPNPRVGCVFVKDGQVIAEGFHARAGEGHAEIQALRVAGEQAKACTAYVTLEPCSHYGKTPPCAKALIDAGVKHVVAAMLDPNPQVSGRGLAVLEQAGISTQVGLLATQARALNPGFISRMERGRPFFRVKLAMSLDGRTAMRSGESQWITGAAARRDVQLLRAQSSAVLSGIGTVLVDDPSLNVRLEAHELGVDNVRQPTRVILDSQCRLPETARLLSLPGQSLLLHGADRQYAQSIVRREGVTTIALATDAEGRLALPEVMQALLAHDLQEIHVEAGAHLCGALLQQQFIDELVVYVAPVLMGSDARSLLQLPLTQMAQRVHLQVADIRAVGDDWRWTLKPHY